MQILLNRQPIFDLEQHIVGYELYHRAATEGGAEEDGYEMAPHVAVNAVIGIGLDRLTEGHPAFLRVTEEMLLNGSVELLTPASVVLVINAATPEPEVVEVCEGLVHAGYRLMADSPGPSAAADSLLALCEMAKVDVRNFSIPELARTVERLRAFRLRMAAVGVDSALLRKACVELGFTLFQGYHFDRAEVIERRDLAIDCLQTFRLMKQIRDPETSDSLVEEGFRHDVALSYKLLRIVNSSSMGGRNIRSIGQAIRLLGRDALNRWLSLLLVSSNSQRGVRAELAHAALVRGRICELMAGALGRPAAGDPLFIVGLFSLFDVLLDMPMSDIAAHLGFAPEIEAAILRREGIYGTVLSAVEAYEEGRWEEVTERCAELGVEKYHLSTLYFDALPWARKSASQAA